MDFELFLRSHYGDASAALEEAKKQVNRYRESPNSHLSKAQKRISDYEKIIQALKEKINNVKL